MKVAREEAPKSIAANWVSEQEARKGAAACNNPQP